MRFVSFTGIFLLGTMACFGQRLNKPNKPGPMGTEVNTATGNLYLSRTDASIPAKGLPINIAFSYNSFEYNNNLGFGNGWSYIYNIRYANDTGNTKLLIWGNGRADRYQPSSGNEFTGPKGFFTTLTQYQPGKYLYRELDGTKYFFDDSTHKKVTRMEDPNGNFINFIYAAKKISSLVNKAGQTISFTWNGEVLSQVTDAISSPARVYQYVYDSFGNLILVRDPANGTVKYSYLVNGPLKTVSDKNNNTIDIVYYQDLSTREIIGCNKRMSFSYDTLTHKTVVTDHFSAGNNQVTTYEYAKNSSAKWLKRISGNCCGFNMEFEYDNNGNKIKEKDANGNIYNYTYDAKGNLLSIKDPLGHVSSYTYSPDFNRMTSYTDPDGNKFILQYDAAGNLVKYTSPDNASYTMTYNADGNIVTTTDANGNVLTYTYDTYGYPATVNGPNGFHAELTHDTRGNVTSYKDSKGNINSAEYDVLNRISHIKDAINQQADFTYDAEGNITAVQNKKNEKYQLSYDASNRLTGITDPKNGHVNFGYDEMDNITSIINPLGHSGTYTYDNQNRLKQLKLPLNARAEYSYDPNGNITGILFPNGRHISCTYDAADRLVKVSDDMGTLASFTYDNRANITSFTDGNGAKTTAEYDKLNRLKSTTDPLGNTTRYEYDNNGNTIRVTDRENHVNEYTYDNMNRLKSWKDKNGVTVEVEYDTEGNIISAKDQNNNITTYSYDNLNRVEMTTFPDGKFIKYSYDANGHITSRQLTDLSSITYQYDSLGRMVEKTLPGGDVYSYTYDALGRIIAAANSHGTVSLVYDALNRIVSENFDGKTVSHEYNIAGRTKKITYPDNTVVTYNYDSRNRLVSIAKNNVTQVSLQYNNADQVISRTFANGITSYYQYDFASRLISISTADGSIQQSAFTYDKVRNKLSVNRLNDPAGSEQFAYDSKYRLVNYKRGVIGGPLSVQNTYTYDAVGNRTAADMNGTNTVYSLNNLNQQTSSNALNFVYDNNGNLTYDGFYYKTYDAEGRLLKDSASPAQVFVYSYDAFGRKYLQTSNAGVSKYTYSALLQIEERDGIADTVKRKTVFGGHLLPVLNETGGISYYLHGNEMNSVEAVTNSKGRLVEHYQYDAYGKPFVFDSLNHSLASSATGNHFGFTGHYYNEATGDYNMHFRNYNPSIGSFTQRDPLEYADGMGMYQYAGDNPANGIDVMGLKRDCPEGNIIYITEKEWEEEVNRARKRLNGSFSAVWEAKNFDSKWYSESADWGVAPSKQKYSFRGKTYSGMEMNYYFQGMLWKAYGYSEGQAEGIVAGWKSVMYNDTPSPGVLEMLKLGYNETESMMKMAEGYDGNPTMIRDVHGLKDYKSSDHTNYKDPPDIPVVPKDDNFYNYNLMQDPKNGELYVKPLLNIGSEFNDGGVWQKPDMSNLIKLLLKDNEKPLRPPVINCPENRNNNGTQDERPLTFNDVAVWTVEAISSKDPNAIIGPDGMPDKKWVSVKDRLPYTILYENDKSASAPAKYVKIRYPIHEKQDAGSFRLSDFGFNNLSFTVPQDAASFYQRVDCRDSLGLYVDVTAGYDVTRNEAFWEFQSIDPVTMLPPSDPLKGFLLLQDTAKITSGHAYVNFSIKPVPSVQTLDSIQAIADIIFDSNDTIPTNIARNIIDALPPASHLTALPTGNNTVTLNWAGVDDPHGCGVQYYTLYVSTDGVNFNIVRSGITRTDTTYSGPLNTHYYFFVLATDSVGNTETLRPAEVQSVFIGEALPVTWLYFKGTNHDKDNLLEWATGSEQNSREFRVERSLDGIGFTTIGTVAAAGNSSSAKSYQYTDSRIDRLNSRAMYYRLKQVDMDDRFKYSNIIRLTYEAKEKLASIVYPNPTGGMITITIGNRQLIGTMASLYDENGRLLESVKITADSQTMDLGKYMNGIYFIHLADKETLRVVKQ